jgi:hypothetical protein
MEGRPDEASQYRLDAQNKARHHHFQFPDLS